MTEQERLERKREVPDLEPEDVFLARLHAIRARKKAAAAAAAEAKAPKLVTTLSPKMAEAIKANPSSLRQSVKAEDETWVMERPRRTEVLEVLEVDAQARPSRLMCVDCMTGAVSVLELVDGYRQPAGAVHQYDPFLGLGRNEND
jgi:hypothetical protein